MAKRIEVTFAGDTKNLDAAFARVKQGSTGMATAFKGLVAGAAFGAVGDAIGNAIHSASDLTESLSKSNTVFGTSGQAIDTWAKGAAANIGLSRQAALEAAGSFGNMFSQLGIGSGQAAELSRNIVGLAADFASFHNADLSDVIAAQSAAFRGEYDAIQRFLPLINAAAVEQEALAMTGKKSKDALTEQEKALAVNALMFKGAGAAQGDFARTSDGAANQQRIFAAELENLKTELGQGFLPVFTSVVSFLTNDAIPAFKEFFGLSKDPPKADGVQGWANKTKDAINDVSGFLFQGIGQGSKLFGLFSESFDKAGDKAFDLAAQLHRTSQEVWEDRNAVAGLTRMQDVAAQTTKSLVGATEKKTAASEKSAKAAKDEAKAEKDLGDAKISARSADLALTQAKHDLTKAQDEYNKFLETGGIDADKVKEAQRTLTEAQYDASKAAREVADAQKAVNEALKPPTQRDIAKAGRDVADAQDGVTTAQLNLTDANNEYLRVTNDAKASDEDRKRAQIAVGEAFRSVADAEDRLAESQKAQTEQQKVGTTQSQVYKDALTVLEEKQYAQRNAIEAQKTAQINLNVTQALGKDHAEKLWEVTNKLRDAELDLDAKTWGAQKAQAALKDSTVATTAAVKDQWGHVNGLKASLDSLPEDLTIKINTLFANPQAALAGIQHDTGNILAGVGGPMRTGSTVNITVNGAIDSASSARQIVGILKEEQRRSGPLGLN
jgi:hypothetical protein